MDQPIHSDQINEITAAMSKAQGEMPSAPKNCKNPHYKSKYADINSCLDACREVLKSHNLAIFQSNVSDENGRFYVVSTLGHPSGQWFKSYTPLLIVKNDSQGFGSAMTYARRYGLCALLGITLDEDDDGNASSPYSTNKDPAPVPKINKQESDAIIKKLDLVDAELKESIKGFLKTNNVSDVKDIPSTMLKSIMTALDENIAKKSA